MKNNFNYKWSKLFASKRYNTKDVVIKLTPEEQRELLYDYETVARNCLPIGDIMPNVSKLYRFIYETSDEDLEEIIEADSEEEARIKFYSRQDEHKIEVLIVTPYIW